ncbi:hypothetical protein [Rhizobium nepotum]|uniref:hypothetical protein n=1 Tax=Rhizobium nepotum TaxID=1035271 RepID=UPI003CF3E6B6
MGTYSLDTKLEAGQHLLDEVLLHTFQSRAADYDRENRFFFEDLADLKAVGYLQAALPVELGAGG